MTTLLLATLARTQPQTDAVPPGIGEESWIPLSDSAGIVVTGAHTRTRQSSDEAARESLPAVQATGVLMARYEGQWVVFDELTTSTAQIRGLSE